MADEEQKSNKRELAVPGDAEIAGHKVSIDELRINNSLFVPTHEIPLRKKDKITFIGAGLGPYNRAGFGLEKGGASFSTVFKSSDSSDAVFIFTVPNDIDRVKDGEILWLKLLSQSSPQFNIPISRRAVYSAKEASDEEAGGKKEGQGAQGGQGAAGAGAQSHAIEEVLINPALGGIAGTVKEILTPAPSAPKSPQVSPVAPVKKVIKTEETTESEGADEGEEYVEENVSENVTGATSAVSAQEVSGSATISQGSTAQVSSGVVGGGSTITSQGGQTIVSESGTAAQAQNTQVQVGGTQTSAVSGQQFQQTGTAGNAGGASANISGTTAVSGTTSVSGTIGSQVSASATGQVSGPESVSSTVNVQAPAGGDQNVGSQGAQAGEAQGGGAGGSVSGAGRAGGTVTAQAPPPPSGVATAAGAGGSEQVSAPSGVSGAAASSQATDGQPSSSQVPSAQKTGTGSAQSGISAPASAEKEPIVSAGGAAPPVSPIAPKAPAAPPPAAGQTISQGQAISPQAQAQAGPGIDGVKSPAIKPSAPTGAMPVALPNLPGTAAPFRLGWQPLTGTTLPNMDAMRRNASALDNALKGATAKGGPKSIPARRPSGAGKDKSPENQPGGPGVAPNIGRGEQPPSQEGGQNPEGTTAPEGAPGTAPEAAETPESQAQPPAGQPPGGQAPPSQPAGTGGQPPPINPNAALPQPPGASDQEQSPGAKQALATATGNPLIRALANSQAASKAAGKATSQIWTWAAVAAYGSGFTIIGFYLGAIVMNVYWIFLYRRDEKLFPLKGWQKVVTILTDLIALGVPVLLIILVLVVGCNFPALTKKIIGYGGTYVGAFIGDSCKSFDIDNLTTGSNPLQAPVPGTAGSGNGQCQPMSTGAASVDNLQNSCFGGNSSQASAIANAESTGAPSLASGVDICANTDGSPAKQPNGLPLSVSWGLFQINLTNHKVGGLDCPSAFDYPQAVKDQFKAKGNNPEFDASNHQCSIKNQPLFDSCLQAAKDPASNINAACVISSNGAHWGAWGANRKCGFNN